MRLLAPKCDLLLLLLYFYGWSSVQRSRVICTAFNCHMNCLIYVEAHQPFGLLLPRAIKPIFVLAIFRTNFSDLIYIFIYINVYYKLWVTFVWNRFSRREKTIIVVIIIIVIVVIVARARAHTHTRILPNQIVTYYLSSNYLLILSVFVCCFIP